MLNKNTKKEGSTNKNKINNKKPQKSGMFKKINTKKKSDKKLEII